MRATAETVFTGGCLCGDVRYQARGAPLGANHCHCTQCQRASGAGMVTWATWPLGAVRVRGKPGVFESSPGVHRSFCPRRGSTLFWRRLAREPAELDIAAGTLDEPDRVSPHEHLFVTSRRRWLPLCDGLPVYREHRPKP